MNVGRPMAMGVVVQTVSPSELYEVLVTACSQDPAGIQSSSKRLKAMMDTMFGTFDALHEIAAQRAVALPVRQQAIIQFKNGAVPHWKSRKLLNDEQRMRIRTRCLTFLDEEDETIAECNQVIVSKIARQDYPANWPNLITVLMGTIDANLQKRYASIQEDFRDTLTLRRSLKLLNALIKEFASLKMLTGVKTMANIVEQLRLLLSGYYSQMSIGVSSSTITLETIGSSRVHDDILLTHLVYKCLIKMAIWLWNRIDKVSREESEQNQAWIRDLFQNSGIQLKTLTEIRKGIVTSLKRSPSLGANYPQRSIRIFTRHVKVFGKFFRRLQQLSHPRFVELPMCGDLVLFYWSQVVEATSGPAEFVADADNAVYPVRFLVQGMVLFKENLAQWTILRRDGTPNKNSLSKQFVEDAVRLLVTRFMPLNAADLDNWMADPEEWVNLEDKENDQWEFEIRPCSERVLMQLSNQFSDFVTPLLADTFKQLAPHRALELSDVVQKEALYCAIGRCAIRLKGVIPFEEWLEHTLAAEARDSNPNYPIIKRRIAWIIGKWVSENCTSPNNSILWSILVHLLQDRGSGTDIVVRLTAAAAMRECADTLDFNAEIFEPFLPKVVSELVQLIGETETMETKRRVDNALNTIIEQAGQRIAPFISIITEPLPQIWTTAGDDWLFKASLLVTVMKLIESVKEQSSTLGAIIVPLIRESLLPGVIVNLDEDGLNLWLAALRNTVTISSVNGNPALSDLFPQSLSLLATNLDLLGKIINIMESYFLLDASGILQVFSDDLFSAFLTALKSGAVTLNQKDMLIALNLLIQLSPSSLWGEALHRSGLFAFLLTKLIDGESDTTLLTHHLFFFSRVVMADSQMFLQLMDATATALNQKVSYLYEGLLDQWWGKFDNMSEPRHRKLVAMGIASLVSTGRPEVLQRLPTEIFNLWLDVFGEIKEVQADRAAYHGGGSPGASPTNLKRFWELDEAPTDYYRDTEGTPEYERRKALYNSDPIRTTQLNIYVGAHVRNAETAAGPQAFQSYLAKADPTVLQQIQQELARA